jgi:transposase
MKAANPQMASMNVFHAGRRAWHRSNETSKRLDAIPGVGSVFATALVASIADPKAFRFDTLLLSLIGLVPRQHSSGGKDRLGSISKQGGR